MTIKQDKLSFLGRLTRVFYSDTLKYDNVIASELYNKYCEMDHKSFVKMNKQFAFLITIDIYLYLITGHKSWTIAWLGTEIIFSPVIKVALIFISGASFFILCTSFINKVCYETISGSLGRIVAENNGVHSDFFQAAFQPFQFSNIIFEQEMEAYDELHYHRYKKLFAIIPKIIYFSALMILHIIIIAHFYITINMFNILQKTEDLHWLLIILTILTFILNFLGYVLTLCSFKEFNFNIEKIKSK